MIIQLACFDLAFANTGVVQAEVEITPFGVEFRPYRLQLIVTSAPPKARMAGLRKSSIEYSRARHLSGEIQRNCRGMDLAAAEIPSGSQSASASRGLGIALGVFAACPVPVIQVNQRDVKMEAVGDPKASKGDMIKWASELYPDLNWPQKERGSGIKVTEAEHLADAIGVMYAAVKSSTFQAYIDAMSLSNEP